MQIPRLVALVLSLSLFGCVTRPAVAPEGEDLPASLARLATQHHVCSVAVAVIKNRKLDSMAFAAGCPSGPTPNAQSVFQAASLSKPVFAYAVLQLVDEGKLDLDTPVVQYLPGGYRHRFNPLKPEPADLVTDPQLRAVTVRMLLNHTAGLPNWVSGPLRFQTPPGAKWEYSGEGYVLLQRAGEAVSGKPLDQLVAGQVFTPLAMHHSSYVWNAGIAQTLQPGTKANGAPRSTLDLNAPVAAFSLYTSVADYGKFLVAVLNDEHALRQITASPAVVDPGLNLSWGLGWGIERTRDDLAIWQWGNNTGYRAFVMASPQTGDGFVMLTNSENGLRLAEPVARKVMPGEHKLFQSPILGRGVLEVMCDTLHVCL